MKKPMVVIFLMALFAWNITSVYAQKPGIVFSDEPGWTHIGETVASFKSEAESIMVIGADEFSAIKIKVEDAPLEIERCQVFYSNGEMEEIDISQRIQPGQQSDVFRLKNPDTGIQKVAFTYNTVANAEGDKADVELYGLKAQDEDKRSEAYRDDAERVERDMERTGEDIERETEKTAEDIERSTENAADELDRETDQAGEEIEEGAEETESDLERAAEKTGDAVAETASKAAAEIDDPRHDTKVGPDGQTIYIGDDEDKSRYYYVNEKGKRVYISEWQLKDKPEEK